MQVKCPHNFTLKKSRKYWECHTHSGHSLPFSVNCCMFMVCVVTLFIFLKYHPLIFIWLKHLRVIQSYFYYPEVSLVSSTFKGITVSCCKFKLLVTGRHLRAEMSSCEKLQRLLNFYFILNVIVTGLRIWMKWWSTWEVKKLLKK